MKISFSQYPVPLTFDTIYYVESPNNEPLNQAMRQIAEVGQPLFADTEVQPFPLKLLCLSQTELSAERLSSYFIGKYDPDSVYETITALRSCLNADSGGSLTARCLPMFVGKEHKDDHAICSFDEFDKTTPEGALVSVRDFARSVAQENFHRLADIPYSCFQAAKRGPRYPRGHSGNTMGFMITTPNPKDILQKMQERLKDINDEIDEHTDFNDVIDMLEKNLKVLKNNYKMNIFCKLFVKDDKLFLEIPEKGKKEVIFTRCDLAKTLYVFYLQQIQRARRNPGISQYLSRAELAEYKGELFEIYQFFSGKTHCKISDLESLWDETKGYAFRDTSSSIRKYFEKEFDVRTIKCKYNKSYFCTRTQDTDQYGARRYGVDIDVEDFDLDQFNY